MSFELLLNGVGDAFSRLHYGTSFFVRKGDFLLAVDFPDHYRRALLDNGFEHRDHPLDVDAIDAAIVTHLHGDHVNGLEMAAAFRRFVHDSRLPLYASPPVLKDLWERRLAASLGQLWDGNAFQTLTAEDFFELHELDPAGPTVIGPFEVCTRPTLHHIPTVALRISDGDATLGYSCDTAYDDELIAWLEDCDLILHESTMGAAHTPLDKLLDLPADLRARLLVVHYPDALADADVGLPLARQGDIHIIAPGG